VKCGHCEKYAHMNYECFMLQKDLKPASEKYIFYDFETTLDPTNNKHIVNYCVAQDFSGKKEYSQHLMISVSGRLTSRLIKGILFSSLCKRL